ncbi:uncharacterized protein LOC143247448 isoform X2 [Tachypleus tridentatus]|uniref:uncharacterized protein LOC143247448 isoform X2 n=1 Tax=Tachypleus tridentatus TaxID=6853 RepID=UPI003FCF3CE0
MSIKSVMPKHGISGSCHEADEKEVPDSKFQKLADPNIYQGLGVENSVHKAKCIFDNISQSSSGEHLKLKNNYTNSHEKHQQKTNSICRPLCKQNNCDRLPDHDRIRYDSNRNQDESSVSTNVKHGTETKEHTVVKPQSSLAVNETVIQENNSKISANSSSSTLCQDSNNRKETLNLGDVACQDATFKNKQKIVECDGKYQQDKTLKVYCVLCQDTKHNKKNMGLNVSVPQSSNPTHDINTESNFVNKLTNQTQERLAISDNVNKCTDHQMIKEDNEDDLSQYVDHTEAILAYHGSKKQNYFVSKIVVNDVTKHQNIGPIQKTMPTAKTVSQDALSIENVTNKKHACARKKISVAENISKKEIELKRVKLEVPDTSKCVLDLGVERVVGSNDYKKQSTSSRESAPESNACIIKGMNPKEEEVTDEVNEKQNFHYNHGLLQKIKPDTLSVYKTIKQLTDFRQEIYVSDNTVNNYAEPSRAKFGTEDTIYQDTEFRKELLSTDDTESQNVIFMQKTLVNDDTASLNIGSKEVMELANNEPVQEALLTDNIVSQNTEPNQVTLEFNCTESKDTNPQQQQITSVLKSRIL